MSFQESGFELIPSFISESIASEIIEQAEPFLNKSKRGGLRNADKKLPSVFELAHSNLLLSQAEKFLSSKPNLVRAILFDKSPQNNWLVTWHQDKTIALSKKFDAEGWGPWSIKDGVHHVQPPIDVLNDMVTFRIHLDESSRDNGCLKVMSGSHKAGLLDQDEIHQYVGSNQPESMTAPALSALVMRPHILHASSKAIKPSRRRVLHLEYCGFGLPEGIYWG